MFWYSGKSDKRKNDYSTKQIHILLDSAPKLSTLDREPCLLVERVTCIKLTAALFVTNRSRGANYYYYSRK